jgi:undecaprenyl-diphosphatase
MFIGISRLSDGWLWLGFAFVLPWLDHHRGTDCVVRMVAVGTLNLLLYVIIKRYVARPRPYRSCDGVQACIRSLDEYSFPSGHTLHSVACGIVICVYYPPLAWVLAPFALLVAMSRVVLGLHYPSDVLIGALMGAVTAGISFNLL